MKKLVFKLHISDIKNYLDEFQTLIFNTNYTDSHTIIVNFKRDFQTTIQNQIATLLIGYLKDTNLTVWFEAIKSID